MSNPAIPQRSKAPRHFSVLRRDGEGGRIGARLAGVRTLSSSDIAEISRRRSNSWQPGLTDQPHHTEIFASAEDASGAGFALALARDALSAAVKDPLAEADDRRQILWVQDRLAVKRAGRPYVHGLPPDIRHRIIHVEAKTAEDALFALEEGLRCRDLAFVLGEIAGNPRALDFTASRRLSLAAEKHGVALWLVRLEADADLSSARMRWRVDAAQSLPSKWDEGAPGKPEWRGELFRARSHAPGQWILNNESGRLCARRPNDLVAANTQDTGDMARPTVGRSLAAL